ncbi:putative phage abortive infection protein [Aeromonas caviae]|uniref:putative phage abortive infection protein n=1 Tax=Aeromonas caviae TaxID=648 RepID=UPI00343B7363
MKDKNFLKSPYFVFGSIILCFVIYIGVLVYNIWPIESKTIGQAGVFGDSFGVLTALFSAFAFGGLIITIWQQQEELDITRKEIGQQSFESTLFKMLEIHNVLVNGIDLRQAGGVQTATGRDCFLIFYKSRLKKEYDEYTKNISARTKKPDDIEIIRTVYKKFLESNQADLGHYFRYIYNIFKFIDRSQVEDKLYYSAVVRAQISDYEALIIFYACLSPEGAKFKVYAEKYALFDNLPKSLLLKQSHINLFNENAFGSPVNDYCG